MSEDFNRLVEVLKFQGDYDVVSHEGGVFGDSTINNSWMKNKKS